MPENSTTTVPDYDEILARARDLLAGINTGSVRNPDPGEPLVLDSLGAVAFKSALDATFGADVPLEILFGRCTLETVAEAVRNHRTDTPPPPLVPVPEHAHEPFPLTEVQQAYWLGSQGFDLGGRSAHFYLELDLFAAQHDRVEKAFNLLISRHGMLRATLQPDGRQRMASEVPYYRIRHADLGGLDDNTRRARLDETRDEMAAQVFDPHTWPLYDIRTHALPGGRLRLHVSVDLLFADANSIQVLLAEWIRLVLDPSAAGSAPALTFRDYVEALAAQRAQPGHERARAYWLNRLDTLPPAPELPVRAVSDDGPPVFVRRERRLSARIWHQLRERATALGVTPSVLLCAAYTQVLRTWSRTCRFTLNLTLADRPRVHPDIDRVIGDFTGTVLLECDLSGAPGLPAVARKLQDRLRRDLAHARFSGVEVQRELARRSNPAQARMPVVFTALLREQDGLASLEGVLFETGYALSQTPQVYLDNQVVARGGDLVISWDAVEEAFPQGVLDDMFATYVELVEATARGDEPGPVPLPPAQAAIRAVVNDTAGPLPDELLHAALDRRAAENPAAPAVLTADTTLTFGELDRRAHRVARRLRELGAARPNTLVAILMHKGWEQVVAALGVLRAGAAYLPVDASLPAERVARLIEAGRANVALTQPGIAVPPGVTPLVVDGAPCPDTSGTPVEPPATGPDDLAYVVFTSGSTGRPKGVMISHRAAANTVQDINERFAVGPRDRVLGLSSLSFDLSVYDIFGVLGAGGALVLPAPGQSRDPSRWLRLADEHRVTLWNSVPPLLELLVEHCERQGEAFPRTVRTALLSGDWIPLTLPGRARAVSPGALRLVSLGGATEAAIWSIWHPADRIDPAWRSIPYGTPLRNQTCHILDADLLDKPDHVTGELFIGGAGVARGYWADPDRTAERFLIHPATGQRLYRTGDLGRYLPDGTIELLGRDDFQVKIGGHRIELGEIEAVLGGHPGVRAAVVVAQDGKRLIAYVVPEEGAALAEELRGYLAAKLPAYMVPSAVVLLGRLPMGPNGKLDRRALPAPGAASADEDHEPPATPVEKTLARVWAAVLPIERVGRHDNFFALGGDSLLVVRAIAKAAEEGLRLTTADFYLHQTVAEQAAVAATPLPAPPTAATRREEVTGRVELAPSQLWFFEQNFADAHHWNGMWPVFELERPMEPGALRAALDAVLAHHDGLRARFARDGDGWYAELPAAEPVEDSRAVTVDLSAVPDERIEAEIARHASIRNGSLDFQAGRTVQLTRFDLGPHRRPRLLVSAHWLVMDYYSSRVFYEDLRTSYLALERGDRPALPGKTASLPECADRLRSHAASAELAAELPYWTRLAGFAPAPLPVDHRLGPNTQASAVRHFVEITGDTAAAVTSRLPRAHGVEIREVLLTALVHALAAWTGQSGMLVEVEGHGRAASLRRPRHQPHRRPVLHSLAAVASPRRPRLRTRPGPRDAPPG
ncbi:amino acid adenylation domain-containing protein [Streptomyces somaliensis]|uniref:non-ribosomal peptide synthetase n=1 Tax=Streptomyces somaliensis TaxID=78355 RepID=UPI0034E94C10|nr:amino acid adenylation domain-containing protein [Streptomyces somaliensis]MCP9973560.1 amino acid adenylation domain-containing protein [Streptomyces somaliensis]